MLGGHPRLEKYGRKGCEEYVVARKHFRAIMEAATSAGGHVAGYLA